MPSFSSRLGKKIVKAAGSSFWIKKTITSSAITTTATAFTTAATGRLAVEDIIVKTDSTGLAGGTNFVISSGNTNGLANIFVETVVNLGANITKAMEGGDSAGTTTSDQTPLITACKTILEAGATLKVNSTIGVCTGAGTIDIFIKFNRVDDNADILPA